ncbi:hypothetical protein GW17_00007117 [Ensete ventricosum]|nr:hypothetical protein GW17_00007117 [Ensete ventricosum]
MIQKHASVIEKKCRASASEVRQARDGNAAERDSGGVGVGVGQCTKSRNRGRSGGGHCVFAHRFRCSLHARAVRHSGEIVCRRLHRRPIMERKRLQSAEVEVLLHARRMGVRTVVVSWVWNTVDCGNVFEGSIIV